MEEVQKRTYVPAAGRHWALPLYDPIVRLLGGGPTREALIRQAALGPAHRALEIGCGTGSLLVELKKRHPQVDAVGLDPDPKALARAERKVSRAGLRVQLDRGFADALPYGPASFDRVFSSFMYHHLPAVEKERTLREVRRVLKPGGSLHLVDFAGHGDRHGRLSRLLHASEHLNDNDSERVVALMRGAGFEEARVVVHGGMLFGVLRVTYFRAA